MSTNANPDDFASPLTLVMTAKSPEAFAGLQQLVQGLQSRPEGSPISAALDKLGTVHFARFVFLGDSQLAVITTYDGTLEDYLNSFVEEIGVIFDTILEFMKDAPPLPVRENREAFARYVQDHDLKCVPPFYSAYPGIPVRKIRSL